MIVFVVAAHRERILNCFSMHMLELYRASYKYFLLVLCPVVVICFGTHLRVSLPVTVTAGNEFYSCTPTPSCMVRVWKACAGCTAIGAQYRYHTAPRIELSLTMGCCSVLAWAPPMPRPGFSGTSVRCRVENMAMIRLRMQEAIV